MNLPPIYHYHPLTGEYFAPGSAYPDPMLRNPATAEPLDETLQAVAGWLVPAHATVIAPPDAAEGMVAVFSDKRWQLVPDHRGETITNTSTLEVKPMAELGPVPDGWTLSPRPDFGEWDASTEAWSINATARDQALAEEVRSKRDTIINGYFWRIQRYEAETRMEKTPTDDIVLLDAYIDDLRNISDQPGFPTSIVWPKAPY